MENIGLDTVWVLIAAALVMLMQAGFSFVELGLTRAKNSINMRDGSKLIAKLHRHCYAMKQGWYWPQQPAGLSGGREKPEFE